MKNVLRFFLKEEEESSNKSRAPTAFQLIAVAEYNDRPVRKRAKG
jgi:hypothetical protein